MPVKHFNFVSGDIVLYDGEDKVVVSSEEYSEARYPSSKYTPIGIIVCPDDHMPDDLGRMMSLRWMNCKTPERGGMVSQTMSWGEGFLEFEDRVQVPVLGNPSNYDRIVTVHDFGYLPSDWSGYTRVANHGDKGTKWARTRNLIPSLYTKDGRFNRTCRMENVKGEIFINPLADFDGRQETDDILDERGDRDYESWHPLENHNEDYPAASCCDIYYTVGTEQGEWYLPSCGELAYMIPRFKEIMYSVEKLNALKGLDIGWCLTSTEYSNNQPMGVAFCSGCIGWGDTMGYIGGSVIAFTKV